MSKEMYQSNSRSLGYQYFIKFRYFFRIFSKLWVVYFQCSRHLVDMMNDEYTLVSKWRSRIGRVLPRIFILSSWHLSLLPSQHFRSLLWDAIIFSEHWYIFRHFSKHFHCHSQVLHYSSSLLQLFLSALLIIPHYWQVLIFIYVLAWVNFSRVY